MGTISLSGNDVNSHFRSTAVHVDVSACSCRSFLMMTARRFNFEEVGSFAMSDSIALFCVVYKLLVASQFTQLPNWLAFLFLNVLNVSRD